MDSNVCTRLEEKKKKKKKKKKKEEEEEEAKELLGEVRDRKQQIEDEVWNKIGDHIASWETETTNAKIWQLTESRETKAQNLENDFTEATAKVQELGWAESKYAFRCWPEREDGHGS